MKKTFILITILVIIVAILVGFKFLGKNKKTDQNNNNQQQVQKETKSESFTGKIKDAFLRNVPLKCTYKMDDNNYGTGWLKNRKYYGEITANGKQGYIILVDNCMWTWDKEKAAGAKMCFEVKEGESIWDEMESQDNQSNNSYNCVSSLVNDDVFNPPSNIKFVDIEEMMKQATQSGQ